MTQLPAQISRLHDLTTLILTGNALTALPDAIGSLSKLKNFEAASNQLTELPASFSKLILLQVGLCRMLLVVCFQCSVCEPGTRVQCVHALAGNRRDQ